MVLNSKSHTSLCMMVDVWESKGFLFIYSHSFQILKQWLILNSLMWIVEENWKQMGETRWNCKNWKWRGTENRGNFYLELLWCRMCLGTLAVSLLEYDSYSLFVIFSRSCSAKLEVFWTNWHLRSSRLWPSRLLTWILTLQRDWKVPLT